MTGMARPLRNAASGDGGFGRPEPKQRLVEVGIAPGSSKQLLIPPQKKAAADLGHAVLFLLY